MVDSEQYPASRDGVSLTDKLGEFLVNVKRVVLS
jgi:hypothetical protein